MQQGNVGSVKKKDVGEDLRRISAQMPVVHLVQRNVKERTADTPLILLDKVLCIYLGPPMSHTTFKGKAVGSILAVWMLKEQTEVGKSTATSYTDSQAFIKSIGARKSGLRTRAIHHHGVSEANRSYE